ncbi:MAG: lysophospholipid acyltransferase family protein [Acidimicrobiia bacterium]
MSDGAGRLQDIVRPLVAPITRRLWRITTEGLDRLPATGPAILCPNHVSFLDSAFVMMFVPRRVSFVGKAEYLDDWKTRYLFPALGMIPIDRSGGENSKVALDTARRVLERGELFGIFPEGTRSRDGVLYKGHTGAARLAVQTGAPIYPVGVLGTREIQPPDAKMPKFGPHARIRIGRPLDLDRYRDRSGDHLVLREITDELMYEIRELTGQTYRNVYATRKDEAIPDQVARIEAA